jgi:U3 small nucleolar RNA-associated protein 21
MTAVSSLRYSQQSELLAFSCDNLSIRIVDMETKKTVRELWGCSGPINDFTFSSDGRWIIAASMDSVIRVWDLPTGHLIDAFQTPSSCTALSFSENGQFLATAHAGEVGVNLWTNKGLFVNIANVEINPGDIRKVDASSSLEEYGTGAIEAAYMDEDGDDDRSYTVTRDQLHLKMVTLSLTPKNHWQSLLHLDVIKAWLRHSLLIV